MKKNKDFTDIGRLTGAYIVSDTCEYRQIEKQCKVSYTPGAEGKEERLKLEF